MLKIIQITDTHLGSNASETLLAMNPDEGLEDVLRLIKQQHDDVDYILATGDIASHPSLSAYQRFYQRLDKHFSAPTYWLPGNHDDPKLMEQVKSESEHRIIETKTWVIFLLNTHVPQKTHGNFAETELIYLQHNLEKYRHKPILLSFHHQPIPIGSRWMDKYIIQNADQFWSLVDGYPNVKCMLWGHIHQEFDRVKNNIRLLATPSTCIQFAPLQDDFTVELTMPGYRWLELHDDGQLKTSVERVPNKDYGVDPSLTGY